jgi:isochorismatase family protein
MIGFSRLLDPPARVGVALLLRRDRRAASPSSTALLLINPIAPLTTIDPAATTELLRTATAARNAGSTIVIARTASAQGSNTRALLVGDYELPATTTLSAFRGTGLHDLLTEHKIDRLLVAGFPTNLDVDSTARHAVELGYHVSVLAAACAAQDRAAHAATIKVTLPRIVHAVVATHGN